jgi:general secretion pathway protein M
MTAYLERFRAWWSAREERERRILSAGAVALGLILFYLLVWEPTGRISRQREAALADARALATLLETLAAEKQRGRPIATVAGAEQSLLAVVDQSRKASTLTKQWSTLRPEGETTVRIAFEDVPFDALLRWLNELQTRYGVRVDNADIERESGPGLVNARLTLMRG